MSITSKSQILINGSIVPTASKFPVDRKNDYTFVTCEKTPSRFFPSRKNNLELIELSSTGINKVSLV